MPAFCSAVAVTGPAIPPPMTIAVLTSDMGSLLWVANDTGVIAVTGEKPDILGLPTRSRIRPSRAMVRGKVPAVVLPHRRRGLVFPSVRDCPLFGEISQWRRHFAGLVPGTPAGKVGVRVGGQLVEQQSDPV